MDLFSTHKTENNIESQSHLSENRLHFNKQMKKIYDLLMKDSQLSVLTAITEEGIHSLPRRIKDLKVKGVSISERWNDQNSPKTKIWYMSKENKENNNKKFN